MTEITDEDVRQLAWLMWCYGEGYIEAEDREILSRWIDDDESTLTAEDVQTRDRLLEMASQVLATTIGPIVERETADLRAEVERLTIAIKYEAEQGSAERVHQWHRANDAEVREAALRQAVEGLFNGGPDTPCHTVWREGVEHVAVPLADLHTALASVPVGGAAAPVEGGERLLLPRRSRQLVPEPRAKARGR